MQSQAQATSPFKLEIAPDGKITRYSFFDPAQKVMRELLEDIFINHWSEITIGPCVDGALFEIRFEKAPEVRYVDGYIRVDLGISHFNICIGQSPNAPNEELRRNRPVAGAALFESRKPPRGPNWGLRLWNGFGDQLATVFFPNAFPTREAFETRQGVWNSLDLYYELRHRLLSEPIPANYESALIQSWPELAG